MYSVKSFSIVLLFLLGTLHAADLTPGFHKKPILNYAIGQFEVLIPATGCLKDIVAAYTECLKQKNISVPDGYEIRILFEGKSDPNFPYTAKDLSNVAIIRATYVKKQESDQPTRSAHKADYMPVNIHIGRQNFSVEVPKFGQLKDIVAILEPFLIAKKGPLPAGTQICIMLDHKKKDPAYQYTHQEIGKDNYLTALPIKQGVVNQEYMNYWCGKMHGEQPAPADQTGQTWNTATSLPNYFHDTSAQDDDELYGITSETHNPSQLATGVGQVEQKLPITTQSATNANPEWHTAASLSKYFQGKYTDMVAAMDSRKAQDSQDYSWLQAGSQLYLKLKKLVSKMGGPTKPYAVIQKMLEKTEEEPNYTILTQLAERKNVRAIAALQNINGGKDPFTYKEKPDSVDPLLGSFKLSNGADVDMTVYRLLYSIIQELDKVREKIQPHTTLYNFVNALDHALE